MASRAYKTLPSAFRKDSSNGAVKRVSSDSHRSSSRSSGSEKLGSDPHSETGIFSGLELKLGFTNLISNGMNLIGKLGRKTPTAASASASSPVSGSNSSSPSSTTSGAYWESRSKVSEQPSSATSANVSELIEMTSFHTVAEGELELQSGKGHQFQGMSSFNPIWCDQCRDLIWGLYDTGAMKCANCNLTCHDKCKSKVQLNCTAFERPKSPLTGNGSSGSSSSSSGSFKDLSTLAGISTIIDEEADETDEGTLKNIDLLSAFNDNSTSDDVTSLITDEDNTLVDEPSAMEDSLIASEELQSALMLYNDSFPVGQETVIENGVCKGFIRVIMNLSRPINVLPGTSCPSVLNLTQESSTSEKQKTLTSFYLPHETEKTLCINSFTTNRDVIRSLLLKFRIVDNPHKYVLYEKKPFSNGRRRSSETSEKSTVTISGSVRSRATLGRINMRRLNNKERPLMIALNNCLRRDYCDSVFVLQENDPGEIDWDIFAMPELKNFLLILDREEASYKREIHEKYEIIHKHMKTLAEQKKSE